MHSPGKHKIPNQTDPRITDETHKLNNDNNEDRYQNKDRDESDQIEDQLIEQHALLCSRQVIHEECRLILYHFKIYIINLLTYCKRLRQLLRSESMQNKQ